MQIQSVKHKGLKGLFEKPGNSVKGLDAQTTKKVRMMISQLVANNHPNDLRAGFPGWKVHELTPKYPGKWSLWVTGNYRLTFMFDPKMGDISELDYEDYH